jgi:hypothetical protein
MENSSESSDDEGNTFGFHAEDYRQFCLEKYNVDFDPYILSTFIPTIIKNMKVATKLETHTVKTVAHPYMYLERQWDMGCWLHSLCAIIGFPFPMDPISNDALVYAMIAFQKLETGDESALEPMNDEVYNIVRPPNNWFNVTEKKTLINSVDVFVNRLRSYLNGLSLIKQGMPIVSFILLETIF